jgi:hypothetical protein
MRDHHDIDRVAVDARRREMGVKRTALVVAFGGGRRTVAGVEQHALAARRQHDRRIGVLHLVGGLPRSRERLGEVVGAGVAQIVAVHRHHAKAIGQDGHFNIANLVAMHFGSHQSSPMTKKAAQHGRPFPAFQACNQITGLHGIGISR